jgi:ABC-type multidrug transport system fused ATPase/permease subunit
MSLRLAAGKTTGIVDVTGPGKTTIAKPLMRFQEVESGASFSMVKTYVT